MTRLAALYRASRSLEAPQAGFPRFLDAAAPIFRDRFRAMRIVRKLSVLAIAASSVALLGACGGQVPEAKVAQVEAGALPTGASWDGVWFNEIYGMLHLVQTGSEVQGKWRRTDGSAWGEMKGNADGNLFRFEWAEYREGFVGSAGTTRGRGYFVYNRPPGDNVDDRLAGEWGLNEDEVGNPWNCIKQRNMNADLNSIGGSDEGVGSTGGWE